MYMNKYNRWTWRWIIVLCAIWYLPSSAAAQERIPQQNTDCEYIIAVSTDKMDIPGYVSPKETYLFTEKSAGKCIPLKPEVSGIMFYSILPLRVELLDENKKEISGNGDSETMDHEEAISVKKDKTYYIKLPDVVVQTEYKMHFYIYPDKIKSLENGKEYMSAGKGKYVYYPFTISKKCLGSFVVSPMYWGDSSIRFTIQKKLSGKWKNIIDSRRVKAVTYAEEPFNPIGLSKGKYRLGIKTSKEQMAAFHMKLCNVTFRPAQKKRKASVVKKGNSKEGVFTWEDKKAHWFKVKKTRKNKIKTISLYNGSLDDIVFTIYRQGKTDALIVWKFHADKGDNTFIKYKRKRFALKENGTYYIKVSKADKKTNGAYKIGVK